MKINAVVEYKTIGVGKHRSKYVYLNTFKNPAIELPKLAIKEFFPSLRHGQDYATKKVVINIV